jgi:signal transduction histidine kinase
VELHDRVGQTLALARMQLATMHKSISDTGLSATVDDISDSLLQTIQDTRHLIYDLSPAGLDELGLAAALAEWMEEQIEKRHGLKTQLIDNGLKEPLEEELRTFLFRSVRELLNNTVKHAQATSVNVRLEQSSAGVKVIVRDDGVGFDLHSASNSIKSDRGFGLFSIQERVADLGGTLEIVSEPGKGMEVILSVSLAKGRESWSDGE